MDTSGVRAGGSATVDGITTPWRRGRGAAAGARGGGLALALSLALGPSAVAQQLVDLPGDDRRLEADFEEVYRVGSLDGELWETFGEIGGTAFDASGNLYIFDRQSGRITMVDTSGEFVREVGEPGEGPGEFRMAVDFTALPDGRLIVADIGHRAYQIFGADGAFERMVSMGDDGGVLRLGDLIAHPSRAAIVSGGDQVIAMRSGPGGRADDEPTGRPIELVDLTGDRIETTVLAEGWRPPREDPGTLQGGGLTFRMSVAGPLTFEPELLVAVLPDGGVVYSDSSAYALRVVGPDGTNRSVLRRPFRPRAVTERIREAERERRLAELQEGAGPQMRILTSDGAGAARAVPQEQIRAMMENRIAQMRFFDELPVVQGLATTWEGRIWVERRGEEPTGPGPIDVLGEDGRYLGTFPAGATEIPSSFGPGRLAAWVELDELDVPSVVVRRTAETMR